MKFFNFPYRQLREVFAMFMDLGPMIGTFFHKNILKLGEMNIKKRSDKKQSR